MAFGTGIWAGSGWAEHAEPPLIGRGWNLRSEPGRMRVWLASLILYCAVFALCELLRWLVARGRLFPARHSALVLEFVGTLQVCAPMFDVNIVLEHYGLQGVLLEITFIELANLVLLRDALADPCPLVGPSTRGEHPLLADHRLLQEARLGAEAVPGDRHAVRGRLPVLPAGAGLLAPRPAPQAPGAAARAL